MDEIAVHLMSECRVLGIVKCVSKGLQNTINIRGFELRIPVGQQKERGRDPGFLGLHWPVPSRVAFSKLLLFLFVVFAVRISDMDATSYQI